MIDENRSLAQAEKACVILWMRKSGELLKRCQLPVPASMGIWLHLCGKSAVEAQNELPRLFAVVGCCDPLHRSPLRQRHRTRYACGLHRRGTYSFSEYEILLGGNANNEKTNHQPGSGTAYGTEPHPHGSSCGGGYGLPVRL